MARRKDDPQFGAPARGKETSSRQPKGRVCSEPGCSTILSTYNKAACCSVHDEPRVRHALYPG